MKKMNQFLVLLCCFFSLQSSSFAQGTRPNIDKAKVGDTLFCTFGLKFDGTGFVPSVWEDSFVFVKNPHGLLQASLDSGGDIPGNLRLTVAYVSGNPVPAPASPEGELEVYLYKNIQNANNQTAEQVVAQINFLAPLAVKSGVNASAGDKVSMLFPSVTEAPNPHKNNAVEKAGLQGQCVIIQ